MRAEAAAEPGKVPAALLALFVHLVFLVLLVFGVTWRTKPSPPVMVEMWQELPAPTPAPPPPPKPAEELKPPPTPAKVEPAPPKPDIALKQEQLRKEREEKERLEAEKRRKAEEKRKEEERRKEDARKEEERKRQEKLKEEQAKKLAAEKEAKAKAAAEQAARTAAMARIQGYKEKIEAKVRSNTIVPPDIVGKPSVTFEITLLPTGEVLNIRLVKSSGFPSYDAAAERAIKKSEPLPVPKDDPALFAQFRIGNYVFRPDD